MRKFNVREVALLSSPIVLLAAVAFWTSRKSSLPNPFDSGPLRVEITGIDKVDLSPLDVARGAEWGVALSTVMKGRAQVTSDWKEVIQEYRPQFRLVYRRGSTWSQVKDLRGPSTSAGPTCTFKMSLKDVPQDAEEVRFRGELSIRQYYVGPVTPGRKPKGDLKLIAPIKGLGANGYVNIATKPFDILVSSTEHPYSPPTVSRQAPLKLMEAGWFAQRSQGGGADKFLLHLRHMTNPKWAQQPTYIVEKLHFFDARGQELILYHSNGKGTRWFGSAYGTYPQDSFSPEKLDSDFVLPAMTHDLAPRSGWGAQKQPLRMKLEVSDGTCWPTQVDVNLRPRLDTAANRTQFGAPEGR